MASVFVVDTSIFMEGKMFDEVPWPSVLGTPEVSMVIPLTVLGELDKLKTAESRRRAERASAVLKRLHKLGIPTEGERGAILREGVSLRIAYEPERARFPVDLDPLIPDDRVIATAQQQGTDCTVITFDMSMEVRCKRPGVRAILLPDEIRVPREPDATERKLAQALQELERLRRRLPTLIVGSAHIQGSSTPIPINLGRVREPNAEEYRAHASEEQTKLKDALSGFATALHGRPWLAPRSDPSRDAGLAAKAHQSTVQRLTKMVEAVRIANQSFLPELTVANLGSAPATNIRVSIRLPKHVIGWAFIDRASRPVRRTPSPVGRPLDLQIPRVQQHQEVLVPEFSVIVSPEFEGGDLVLSGSLAADELPEPLEWGVRFSVSWTDRSPWTYPKEQRALTRTG